MRSRPTPPLRHTGERGCNPIDRLQPVSRKPGRFGELLWYRLRKHKLASVQKLFFWTRDSRDRTKLLRSFPWAELDYILESRCPFRPWIPVLAGMTLLQAVVFLTVPATGEEPKYGGTLNYMIPADAPPSFDGHRESTYATVHSV